MHTSLAHLRHRGIGNQNSFRSLVLFISYVIYPTVEGGRSHVSGCNHIYTTGPAQPISDHKTVAIQPIMYIALILLRTLHDRRRRIRPLALNPHPRLRPSQSPISPISHNGRRRRREAEHEHVTLEAIALATRVPRIPVDEGGPRVGGGFPAPERAVVVVVVVAAVVGSGGGVAADEGAQVGRAGADDSELAFDDGPDEDVVGKPGGVDGSFQLPAVVRAGDSGAGGAGRGKWG
jgi:hypothetical protein